MVFKCKAYCYIQLVKTRKKRRRGILFVITLQSLASGNLRSRNRVAVEVVVDVGSVARVGRLDVSRDLSGRREGLASATSDLQVS